MWRHNSYAHFIFRYGKLKVIKRVAAQTSKKS
jgi:hypothetical protein